MEDVDKRLEQAIKLLHLDGYIKSAEAVFDARATISRLTAERERLVQELQYCVENIQGIMDEDDIPSTVILRRSKELLAEIAATPRDPDAVR